MFTGPKPKWQEQQPYCNHKLHQKTFLGQHSPIQQTYRFRSRLCGAVGELLKLFLFRLKVLLTDSYWRKKPRDCLCHFINFMQPVVGLDFYIIDIFKTFFKSDFVFLVLFPHPQPPEKGDGGMGCSLVQQLSSAFKIVCF